VFIAGMFTVLILTFIGMVLSEGFANFMEWSGGALSTGSTTARQYWNGAPPP
jgi:hypothetical protein